MVTNNKVSVNDWAREHLEDELMSAIQEIEVNVIDYNFSLTSTQGGKVKMTCRGYISTQLSVRSATFLAGGFVLAGGMLLTFLAERLADLPTQISLLVTFFT